MTETIGIEVAERRSTLIDSDVAETVPSDFWRAADCTVRRSPGDQAWTLAAGDCVGVGRIITGDLDITLTVVPKLPDADMFFLADYAFGQRHESLRVLDFDQPTLAAVHKDPTACLLLWHVGAISRFASRWLRRDYRSSDRTFKGKVKGRILLDRYITDHIASGRSNEIPCRTIEQTQDTPNNQVLKAGLRHAAMLSHSLPVAAAGVEVRRQVSATLPKFSQVSDIAVTPSVLRSTSVRGPQRHYAMILRATRSLLASQFTGVHAGGLPTESFMWDMPTLFQESVRGIISMMDDVELDEKSPPAATIYDSSGAKVRRSKVDPDLVIVIPGHGAVLLDTKYKNVLSGPTTSPESDSIILSEKVRISVSRADIYQAVAYSQHERWSDDVLTSGLLFPVSLPAGATVPEPVYVHGFGISPNPLIFIDIGPHARQNLEQFRSAIRQLHGGRLLHG
ncbi:5-methylcytosine restriction system specificity protein McrC [Gordonia otitidis]|uniref:McrBC 5-methylcytosine restriction system component n=1 Tax=Gordonia otitidis (strain DSM 44809 / CCUG 52243 / JCM 12355 / NBRC 100426 / IFM 10032) TaxID=1108044 RepID=H5TID4_GORO1|nr:hypothetical protein [Gordonia otitidis]GAB33242.1 hypothetical protein GOOTI_055_00030 [Gordonia otitidis NBRC 100426]